MIDKLSDNEISIIDESFNKLGPSPVFLIDTFYHELYRLNPSIEPYIENNLNLKDKSRIFLKFMTSAVLFLNRDNVLNEVKDTFDKVFSQINISPKQFYENKEHIVQALLLTIENELGNNYTSDIQLSWSKYFTILFTKFLE